LLLNFYVTILTQKWSKVKHYLGGGAEKQQMLQKNNKHGFVVKKQQTLEYGAGSRIRT
jgi:hypothetical protein